MELQKLDICGLNDVYTLSVVQKEFKKAVNEKWLIKPPWKRYQKKLLQDLAILEQEKEHAIEFPQYEKLSVEENIYSIRHPETKKNVRVLYTIEEGVIILLVAFLEKNDGDYRNAINLAKDRIKWLNT